MSKVLLVPLALAAALAASVLAVAAPAAENAGLVTGYGAVLAPGGEHPAPAGVSPDATGLFSSLVTKDGNTSTISWTLRFAHLTGKAVAAHVHIGAPGSSGPAVLTLCGPCSSGQSGQAPLSAKLADAISSGNAYVNVHTPRNQGGEIRGEVGLSHALAAGLVPENEPAKPSVPGARGSFTALIVDAGPRPVIAWSLGFGALTGAASGAHIHLGKAGESGPIALALCGPCKGRQLGRKEIDPNLAKAIEAGGAYVNVHTAANAAGEIRGALQPASQGVSTIQTALGTVLMDDRGLTLYMWDADAAGKSVCYGRCAGVWPPALSIGPAVAGGGAKASLLKVAHRTDGTSMLTYNGFPLYGFFRDANPGDTNGEAVNGFGAKWWVLAPDGSKITK